MQLPSFKLEDFLSKWEFNVPYSICNSDPESFSLKEILALADEEDKALWEHLSLGYTETQGSPSLRKEIANLYADLSNSHILCFAGAEEGIYCTFQTLLKPGDHVIIVTPCYPSLLTLPASLTHNVTEVLLSPEKNWELDPEKIKAAIRPETRMLVINFPHNPTGATLKQETLQTLVALARKHNFYIFADEVYRYMEIDPQDRLPAISELYEKGISLGVMSKTFGLPGLRIGWVATRDAKTLQTIAAYKHYTSICNSAPSEILAQIALKKKEVLLARIREIILANLTLLDSFFEKQSAILSWVRPKGGCTGFAQIKDNREGSLFIENLIREKGVLLLPGSVYNYSDHFFRIGFGRKNFSKSLKVFEESL